MRQALVSALDGHFAPTGEVAMSQNSQICSSQISDTKGVVLIEMFVKGGPNRKFCYRSVDCNIVSIYSQYFERNTDINGFSHILY
jgi:hypothetical protein